MSAKELRRLPVIEKVISREESQVRAAELLGLSERQVGRIVHRVRAEGEVGILHQLRGRSSCRRIPDAVRDRVTELYRDGYEGFGLIPMYRDIPRSRMSDMD